MSNRRAVQLSWTGRNLVFEGGGTEPVTPKILLDGAGAEGPSPTLSLLLAAGACSASDVVLILQKMRVDLRECTVEVEGVRREREPRRFMSMRFRFRLAGDGLDHAKAERAVRLSLDKYCSVVHTLAPDVKIEHEIELA